MDDVLSWVAFLALIVGYFSFMYMVDYLYKRKIVKHRLYGFKPHVIFLEYYKLTKQEKGHVDTWFWLSLFSILLSLISGLLDGIYMLFTRR